MSRFTRLVGIRRGRGRRGGNAIEFALIFPVLAAITASIIDYGWYYSLHLGAIHAAREAGRTASVTPDTGDPCTAAENAAVTLLGQNGLTADASNVTTTVYSSATRGMSISVVISVPYTALWGLVPTPAAHNIDVDMRLEDQDHVACGPQ